MSLMSLVDAGADVNARDANGDSLLKTAVSKKNLNIIDILVEAGALP